MPQANADVVALELEKVRKKLPLMYERDNVFFAKVKAREDITVSSRSARVPLELRSGGRGGKYNPDGGDMGRGSGAIYEVGTLTPQHFRFGVEINKLVEIAQRSEEQAVASAAKKSVKQANSQFRGFLDKLSNAPKTGILATIASGASGTTWTLTADTSFRASQRFYVGQPLHVSDLTTTRTDGTVVTSITDPVTITVNASNGATDLDTIAVHGSTASGGAITSTALFGVSEFNNSSTSGTYLSLTRSSFPEVLTPEVAAGGNPLSTAYVRLSLNKIKMALGVEAATDLTWYTHPSQLHAYEDIGINISEIVKGPSSDQQLDPFFNPKTIAGWPVLESINASRSRLDGVNFSTWGRVVMDEIDMHRVGSASSFPVYASGGGLVAAYLYYLVTSFQLFSDNPRKSCFVSGLAIPSGY